MDRGPETDTTTVRPRMRVSSGKKLSTGLHPLGIRMPPLGVVSENFAYRYYFTPEFGFGRKAVCHIRRRRIEIVLGLLRGMSGCDLLDVGCGPGDGTLLLERHCAAPGRVIGVDLGWQCAALGRQLASANGMTAHFLQAEAGALPFRSQSFDAVISWELIEHLPHYRTFLAEAHRVLRPRGHLVLSTPTRAGFHSWLKRAWVRLRRLDRQFARYRRPGDLYERFLGRRELVSALEESGFEIISQSVKIFVFSFLPDWLFPLNCALEPILESLPGVRRLGVTAFYHCRKV